MHKLIDLIVVDDHAIVRDGLIALLEDESGLNVIGQADNGHDAIRMVAQHHPDIVLMDITLGDMNGLDATRRCKAERPDVKIIVLTMHTDEAFFSATAKVGYKK